MVNFINFVRMSKILAILLSSVLLLQTAGISASDVLHLDEFIEHAKFHKTEHGDSFFTFLSKHYGEQKSEHSQKHEEEKNEHEQLPFNCQGQFIVISALLLNQPLIVTNNIDFSKETETNFYYQSSFSSLHKQALLQPPKNR